MFTLRGALEFVSYGASLDILEYRGNTFVSLFPECGIITRGIIENFHPELLDRELSGGLHAEGSRKDRLVIPLKGLD